MRRRDRQPEVEKLKMMKLKNLVAASAAAALALAPVAAPAAATAQPADEEARQVGESGRGIGAQIYVITIFVGIVIGAFLLSEVDDDEDGDRLTP